MRGGGSRMVFPSLHEALHEGGAPRGLSPFAGGFAQGGGAPTWSFPICTRLCTRRGGSHVDFSPLHKALHEGGGSKWPPPNLTRLCTRWGGSHVDFSPLHKALHGGGSHLASPPLHKALHKGRGSHVVFSPLHEALHRGGGLPCGLFPFVQGFA